MIRYDKFRLVLIVAVLLTSSIPTALYGAYIMGYHPSLPSTTRQAPGNGNAQLGIDCGYGSNEAVANATGYPGPDGALASGNVGTPTLDASCTWAGSPDIPFGGTQLQPLVSDNPTITIGPSCCSAPSKGGGFTAEIVFIQNASTVINGYDVSLSWVSSLTREAFLGRAVILSRLRTSSIILWVRPSYPRRFCLHPLLQLLSRVTRLSSEYVLTLSVLEPRTSTFSMTRSLMLISVLTVYTMILFREASSAPTFLISLPQQPWATASVGLSILTLRFLIPLSV